MSAVQSHDISSAVLSEGAHSVQSRISVQARLCRNDLYADAKRCTVTREGVE